MRYAALALGLALGACAAQKAAETPPALQTSAACHASNLSVYFDSWQAELTAQAQEEIAGFQRALAGCAIDRVRIVGMAGAPGEEAANMAVSQQRADLIAAALQRGGWSTSRFEIVAIGEQDASTPEGMDRPMRRRVEISVQASPAG